MERICDLVGNAINWTAASIVDPVNIVIIEFLIVEGRFPLKETEKLILWGGRDCNGRSECSGVRGIP